MLKIKKLMCRVFGHKPKMAKIVVKRVWKRTTAKNVYCVGTLYICERCGATKVDWLKGTFTKNEIKTNLGYNVKNLK